MLFRGASAYPARTTREFGKHHPPDAASRPHSVLDTEARQILQSRQKRIIDLLGASLLALFFLPAIILISLAIAVDGRGPVIFRQERYGAAKKVFWLYKFRSMKVCESSGSFTQASRGDDRITAVGRVLRRTSLDELPQLFNVLAGDMSLVGPRPHAVAMDDAYAALLPRYTDRHLVKPGLTGLAQITGYRGPTDGYEKIAGRLREDRRYISDWSPRLDLEILLKTPYRLLGPNAH